MQGYRDLTELLYPSDKDRPDRLNAEFRQASGTSPPQKEDPAPPKWLGAPDHWKWDCL